jgi:RecA/RadA recombinase
MDKLLESIGKYIMTEKKEKKKLYFSTGSTLLDLVVGGGEKIGFGMGYEAGTIVRDWGGSSSTKTFKACELIASAYHTFKDKFIWKYADIEGGNTINSNNLYGFEIVNPNRDEREIPLTVEEWEWDVSKFLDVLKEDECGIYVLDSLDSLSSKEIEDRKEERHKAYDKGKELDKGSYGMASAKFLSQEMFRGLSAKLAEKNALLYVISQERDNANAGMYGKKNRLGGGRAIGFYETARIYSKLREKEEKEGRTVSVLIETTAEKTRHPRPYRSCFVPIIFDYGIDDISANVDFLFDCRSKETGEILKRADKLTWDKIGNEIYPREDLIQYIDQNGLKEDLRLAVIQKWEEIEERIKIIRKNKYE